MLRGTPATAAATAAAALAALWLWSGVRLYPELLYRWTESSFYPEAALRYLRAAGPPERLLNLYNWGGYIALHAPEVRVFIDGRANTLYDDEIYLEYMRVSSVAKGYRSILERRRFDVVLFPTASGLAQALRADPDGWRAIYSDRLATLLVRSDAPYLRRDLPRPADVVGDHPDFDVVRARRLALDGDPWAAAERMEAMVAAHPRNVPVWGDLARVYAWQGKPEAIGTTIERAIAKNPRAAARLHEFEGYSYEIAGDLERAIEALRLATPGGPFRSASGVRRYTASLEQRRQRGASGGGGP